MNRHTLTARLRFILIGVGICGLLLYTVLLPYLLGQLFPDAPLSFWPYLVFLWASGIPCYLVLICGWRIVCNIRLDRSFCRENAALLSRISTLAALDAAFIFAGELVAILLGAGHVMLLLLSLIVIFAGIAVAVAAAALSHLVLKAADLQEQCDLTI